MIEVAAIGLLAGVVAGLLGVGGGVLFVPGLVFVLGLTQVGAEATSLLAIVPVGMLGAWQQHRYGNVCVRDGLLIGLLAAAGSIAGVAVANIIDARTLRFAFAGVLVLVAGQLVRGSRSAGDVPPDERGRQ